MEHMRFESKKSRFRLKKWNAKSGFLIFSYRSDDFAASASFPVENKMAVIRMLALFDALLDLINDEYQLATKYTDNSILSLISASNEKKERQQAFRITGYAEQIIRSHTDSSSRFRLSRTSAELLTGLLGVCPSSPLYELCSALRLFSHLFCCLFVSKSWIA